MNEINLFFDWVRQTKSYGGLLISFMSASVHYLWIRLPLQIKIFVCLAWDEIRLRQTVLGEVRKKVPLDYNKFDLCFSLVLPSSNVTFVDSINWKNTFHDVEDYYALHRWYWLTPKTSCPSNSANVQNDLNLVREWCAKALNKHSWRKDAYSAAERVANLHRYFKVHCHAGIPEDLTYQVFLLGQDIARNLECHGRLGTGNHILNNARGLFLSGHICRSPYQINLSRALLKKFIPILISDDGFLREGSSHYHLLVCSWMVEILDVAIRNSDQSTEEILRPVVKKMIEKTLFFVVIDQNTQEPRIPLVGDVSPDASPKWLLHQPWLTSALKNKKVVLNTDLDSLQKFDGVHNFGQNCPSSSITCVTHEGSGWYKFGVGDYLLYLYAQKISGKITANHSHFDLGSFVLFYKGAPIVIDIGRASYSDTDKELDFRSPSAHNLITVDGVGAIGEFKKWMPGQYRLCRNEIDFEKKDDNLLISIRHFGFLRLPSDNIVHERKLQLKPRGLSIFDSFTGHEKHLIDEYLHFSKNENLDNVQRSNNGYLVNEHLIRFDDQLNIKIADTDDSGSFKGWCSSEYGTKEPCFTMHASGLLNFPLSIETSILRA